MDSGGESRRLSFMIVETELRNCSLELHYVGTRDEIIRQIALDAIDELSKSVDALSLVLIDFGKNIKNAFEPLSIAFCQAARVFAENSVMKRE
jgi:hypothetical protein